MASNIVFTAEKTEISEQESFSVRRTGWDTWDASLPWETLSDCIMTLTEAFSSAQGTTTRGITYQVRNIAGNYRPMSKLQWLDTDGQEYVLSIHYDELPLLAAALSDLAVESGEPLDLDFSKLGPIKPFSRFDLQLANAVKDEDTEFSKAVQEIGAEAGAGAAPVQSVNGQEGDIVLGPGDVGAAPDSVTGEVSDLNTLTTSGRLSDAQIATKIAAEAEPLTVGGQRAVRNRSQLIDAVAEGADNTGTTDARTAISTSVGLLPASGGTVRLRKGSYKLTSRIICDKANMVLEGEGPGNTILLPDVAALQAGADYVTIRNLTIRGGAAGTQGALQSLATGAFKHWHFENVVFENVAVTLRRLGAIQNTGVPFTSGSAFDSHITFENCEFSGFKGDGLLNIGGVHHVTVNNCWFHDSGVDFNQGDMLKLSAGAMYWTITNNRFERGTRDAIDCYDGHRGLIQGNTIVDMGVHGIEMKVVNNSAPNPADRNRVIGNHIVNVGTGASCPGIQCATSNCIISDNLLEGGGGMDTGIRIGKVTDGSSNTHDNIVIGNRVIGANGNGIASVGCDGVVVLGNIVTDCGTAGYYVPSATLNTNVKGSAALNVSRNNVAADDWA